mmetsp:Transcript_6877/g.12516  ORF Transcript_6877/g.12516 Transcript_6877/m.12516 type:complete len:104 (+) Transcript_6877:162-473(+)
MSAVGYFKHSLRIMKVALVIDAIALGFTYFIVFFNTRAATYEVCDSYSDVCMEDQDADCKSTSMNDWQGLMYLIGLSLMMSAEGLLGYSCVKPYFPIVVPVSN